MSEKPERDPNNSKHKVTLVTHNFDWAGITRWIVGGLLFFVTILLL